jgi:hypothetical protein
MVGLSFITSRLFPLTTSLNWICLGPFGHGTHVRTDLRKHLWKSIEYANIDIVDES